MYILRLIALSLFRNSTSVNITCFPGKCDYNVPAIPCCEVKDNLKITSEYEQLSILDHSTEFRGFKVDEKLISYLPSGIEKCCGPIELLMIKNCSLKVITPNNLQSYPNLTILDLSFNKIRVLEADLFKSNSKIQAMYLNGNQIAVVAPKVFDNMRELKFL